MTLPLISLVSELRLLSGPSSTSSRPRPRSRSSVSSKVVAEVDEEPCADELLLWGGDGLLRSPLEARGSSVIEIDRPSPAPLSKLGV